VIRVYDHSGNVIETPEQAGEFKEWWVLPSSLGGFGSARKKLAVLQRFDTNCLYAARNRLQDAV
jgi:hypothetical protein